MNTVEIHLNLDPGKSLNHIFHHPTHLRVFILYPPLCLMNLYGEFILSHPSPDATKNRNQIGGFEELRYQALINAIFFGESFIFLQKKSWPETGFREQKTPG